MAKRRTGRPRSLKIPATDPTGSSTGRRIWAGILVCAGFAVYWSSLAAPFLFDDEPSIVNNLQIRDLTALTRVLSPPHATPVAGRPFVNLSFAVNYALGGLDVRGYHLFNISVHVLAALVLFGIVRRTLGSDQP